MSPLLAAAAVVAAVFLAVALWRLLRPRRPPAHIQQALCTSCGWKGSVSRYAGRCPACNAPLGERRARPPG